MNSFTNSDWENGIYRKAAGFSIPDTTANKASFVKGASVKPADGQVRQVAAVYDVGDHLSVMLSGSTLSASAVGYPKTISVVTSTGGTTAPTAPVTSTPAPAPAPTPAPAPAPTTPVVSDGSGIDLVGVKDELLIAPGLEVGAGGQIEGAAVRAAVLDCGDEAVPGLVQNQTGLVSARQRCPSRIGPVHRVG